MFHFPPPPPTPVEISHAGPVLAQNSPGVDLHRQPDVVGAGPAPGVPRVAHVDVRRLLGAADGQLERVLRVVSVLGCRRDVRAAGPGPRDRVRPEDLVRVRAPARLARGDQEVDPVRLDDARRLVCPGPYIVERRNEEENWSSRTRRMHAAEQHRSAGKGGGVRGEPLRRSDIRAPTVPSDSMRFIWTIL